MLRSRHGLAEYKCLRACLLWVLFVSAAVTLLFHWRVFALMSPDASAGSTAYLPGLFNRTAQSPIYQLFIGSALGVIGYAISVLTALGGRLRMQQTRSPMSVISRIAHRLCGIPTAAADKENWSEFVEHGAPYAISAVRDAAVIYPGIGFLGTVVGISVAIGGLAQAVESRDLSELTTGLRIAFDTTFFGLVAALVLSLLVLLAHARLAQAEALGSVTEGAGDADTMPPEQTADEHTSNSKSSQ